MKLILSWLSDIYAKAGWKATLVIIAVLVGLVIVSSMFLEIDVIGWLGTF